MKVAMSESPEVCQFPPTEAISPHCYHASASNWKQRLKFGTFAFTNFVKLNVYLRRLSQDYMHFFCMFHPSVYFWGNNRLCITAHNDFQCSTCTTIFAIYTGQRGSVKISDCNFAWFNSCMHRAAWFNSCMHRAACQYRYAELLLFTCRFIRTDQA